MKIRSLLLAVLFFNLFGGESAARAQSSPYVLAQGEGVEVTLPSEPGTVVGYTWAPDVPEQNWAVAFPGAADVYAPAVT